MKLAIVGSRNLTNISLDNYVTKEIKEIVNYADKVLVFWNGSSKGTLSVIKYAEKIGKPFEIILFE